MRLNFFTSLYRSADQHIFTRASQHRIKLQQQVRTLRQPRRQYDKLVALDIAKKTLSSLEKRPHIVALVGVTTVSLLNGLERVPGTGRWRLNCLPDRLALQYLERLTAPDLEKFKEKALSETTPEAKLVRSILDRLIPHAGAQNEQSWDCLVVNDPLAQAMTIPNMIMVTTGLVHAAESEDVLAAAIAHEIGHRVAGHLLEETNLVAILTPPFFLLGLPFWWYHKDSSYFAFLYSMIVKLPHSRMMEHEADYLAMMILARSCYDPGKIISVMELLDAAYVAEARRLSYHPKMWFTASHPLLPDRIRKIEEWLPEALALRKASGDRQTRACCE